MLPAVRRKTTITRQRNATSTARLPPPPLEERKRKERFHIYTRSRAPFANDTSKTTTRDKKGGEREKEEEMKKSARGRDGKKPVARKNKQNIPPEGSCRRYLYSRDEKKKNVYIHTPERELDNAISRSCINAGIKRGRKWAVRERCVRLSLSLDLRVGSRGAIRVYTHIHRRSRGGSGRTARM